MQPRRSQRLKALQEEARLQRQHCHDGRQSAHEPPFHGPYSISKHDRFSETTKSRPCIKHSWPELSSCPQMVSGEGQVRNVPLLVRTIFTVQTASSTRLVDSAFNKLSQDSVENYPLRRGQRQIYRQTLIPSGQKSSEVCAGLRCRICDSSPPTREANRCIRRPSTRGSRVSISLEEGSEPQKWAAAPSSRPD